MPALSVLPSSLARVAVLALLASALAAGKPVGQTPADSARARVTRTYSQLLVQADSIVRRQGGPRADRAQLFLTWDAPYGMRRATDRRVPACGDTLAGDTLWLTFLPGRSSDGFNGFTGDLWFRAAPGETLGTWWHFEHGAENAGNLIVEWGPHPSFGTIRQPWAVPGQGFVKLDRTPESAHLRMVYAVAHGSAAPIVPDSLYTLCRVVLRHRGSLSGCEQRVCVEWANAGLAFAIKDEPQVRRGQRFVSWGAGPAVCDPWRGPRVEAWKPKRP